MGRGHLALDSWIVLDSGALSALAERSSRARLILGIALKKGAPLVVPAVVLAESLTATSRDANTNVALSSTTIIDIDERLARSAADLRHKRRLRRAGTIDAIVVACADRHQGSTILTSDAKDLRPLAAERGRSHVVEI